MKALVLCDTAHKIGSFESWNARIATVERDGIESIGGLARVIPQRRERLL